jgi:hypothetical protein
MIPRTKRKELLQHFERGAAVQRSTIMEADRLRQTLSDAGCPLQAAGEIVRLCGMGMTSDALRLMKKDRCRLMEEMHECGRKVDRMDLLIRLTEKELEQTQIKGGK